MIDTLIGLIIAVPLGYVMIKYHDSNPANYHPRRITRASARRARRTAR